MYNFQLGMLCCSKSWNREAERSWRNNCRKSQHHVTYNQFVYPEFAWANMHNSLWWSWYNDANFNKFLRHLVLILLWAMVTFSCKSIALKWNIFFRTSSIVVFDEYFAVFMKQLGMTPSQIGITSLFGIQIWKHDIVIAAYNSSLSMFLKVYSILYHL